MAKSTNKEESQSFGKLFADDPFSDVAGSNAASSANDNDDDNSDGTPQPTTKALTVDVDKPNFQVSMPRKRSQSQLFANKSSRSGGKYLGPRMKVLIWNDKSKSFAHVIRCNRDMFDSNASTGADASNSSISPALTNFYEIRRNYDDFEYLYYILDSTLNHKKGRSAHGATSPRTPRTRSRGKSQKHKRSKDRNHSKSAKADAAVVTGNKSNKGNKSPKNQGNKDSHKKRSSFLGGMLGSSNNSNARGSGVYRPKLTKTASENARGTDGLLSARTPDEEERKGNANGKENERMYQSDNGDVVEIPAIPDKITLSKGLFPNIKKMREETKQQAIELQVFITKLYFNPALWHNKFVKLFFGNFVEFESEFEKSVKLKYYTDIQSIEESESRGLKPGGPEPDWGRQITLTEEPSVNSTDKLV